MAGFINGLKALVLTSLATAGVLVAQAGFDGGTEGEIESAMNGSAEVQGVATEGGVSAEEEAEAQAEIAAGADVAGANGCDAECLPLESSVEGAAEVDAEFDGAAAAEFSGAAGNAGESGGGAAAEVEANGEFEGDAEFGLSESEFDALVAAEASAVFGE